MYVYTYTCMYVTALNKQEVMNLQENKEEYIAGLEGGKEKRNDIILISKVTKKERGQ